MIVGNIFGVLNIWLIVNKYSVYFFWFIIVFHWILPEGRVNLINVSNQVNWVLNCQKSI